MLEADLYFDVCVRNTMLNLGWFPDWFSNKLIKMQHESFVTIYQYGCGEFMLDEASRVVNINKAEVSEVIIYIYSYGIKLIQYKHFIFNVFFF